MSLASDIKLGGKFTPAPAGNHLAVCYKLIDLGTQYNDRYNTSRRQVFIGWELPNELVEVDGKQRPAAVGKFYTNVIAEKSNLKNDLESWRGQAFTKDQGTSFDLTAILGKPCMLNIIHVPKQDGNIKAVVSSIARVPKEVPNPEPVNDPIVFTLENFDQEVFNNLGKGLQETIMRSEEYRAKYSEKAPHDPNGMDKLYKSDPMSQVDEGPDW
jgi:hypothetical protein